MSFGKRLRQAREQAQHTQGALAEIMVVSRQQILRWEAPGTPPPRVETIAKLAAALGVSACWLAFGEERE